MSRKSWWARRAERFVVVGGCQQSWVERLNLEFLLPGKCCRPPGAR